MDSFPFLLPPRPTLAPVLADRVAADYRRFREALPEDLAGYCREQYGVDLTGSYAGRPIRLPFGKASGQLSLNRRQVQRDAEAGLGFVVLKTVIAEDPTGQQSMAEWAIYETHMRVDRIEGEEGEPGWTVTWKGRGWHDTFPAYLDLVEEAAAIGQAVGMPVAPSVKYHLPSPGERDFREAEYAYTTAALLERWRRVSSAPMPLEKDFSPTLAGDDRSREQEQIRWWLERVPDLIRGAVPPGSLSLGVKLMNARFDLPFQVEMCRAVVDLPATPPDFLVYANRLFAPDREFEGKMGVAFGGPDLSRRNLRGLRAIVRAVRRGDFRRPLPEISGTGDILTGRMAAEYGLLGASSCQMHTVFQLPDSEFAASMRNKVSAVLHHLLFHPESGLVPWLLHLGQELGRTVHWSDLPAVGRERLAAVDQTTGDASGS